MSYMELSRAQNMAIIIVGILCGPGVLLVALGHERIGVRLFVVGLLVVLAWLMVCGAITSFRIWRTLNGDDAEH